MTSFKKPLSRFAHIAQIQHFYYLFSARANLDSIYIIGKNQTRKAYN